MSVLTSSKRHYLVPTGSVPSSLNLAKGLINAGDERGETGGNSGSGGSVWEGNHEDNGYDGSDTGNGNLEAIFLALAQVHNTIVVFKRRHIRLPHL